MIRSITDVKKEIRMLGLDACNPKRIVGVVIRGGLYLDGVIVFDGTQDSSHFAKTVTKTKYFPELRVIMFHDPQNSLDDVSMQRITKLPVIRVCTDSVIHKRGYEVFVKGRGKLWVKTRLESYSLQRILSLARTRGRLPEPLRVAHLLAKLSIAGESCEIKNKFARTLFHGS